MLLYTTITLLILLCICNITLWRTFKLYLETIDRYENERDEERINILIDTLSNIRKRMRIMMTTSMILMVLTPLILLTAE